MKYIAMLGGLIIVVLGGAFVYIAVSDVDVPQTTVTKEVSTGDLSR